MMLTRDLSKGGMFLFTDQPFAVGDVLLLEICPPRKADPWPIKAMVRHVAREAGTWGIGVEFLEQNESSRSAMWSYLLVDE